MSDISEIKTPPAEALKRLAAIDPRLSMRWVDGVLSYWAITEKWKENDPRREMIQKGELAPTSDFDVKAFLPQSCSPYEIEGYIALRFERVTDTAKQAEEAVQSVERANNARKEAVREEFMAEQDEKAVRTTKHELEVQMGVATANAQITVPADIGKKKK